MKTWNAPKVQELNINETAGGFIKIGWEGPLDIVFGKEETTPELPESELPKDTVNPSGE